MSVYLDHNATTPIDERVLEAMLPYMREQFGNPSSGHQLGKQARAAVNLAREQVASLVNAHPSQVVFTSGGTEANNTAIKGLAARMAPGLIALSEVEHDSVSKTAEAIKTSGWSVAKFTVDGSGCIEESSLLTAVTQSPKIMALMLANNETGVVNDTGSIAELARECGVLLLTDAVQAAGKIPLDFKASGVHMMSLSAHKLYGPKGTGALIVDKAIDMEALLPGGGQEKGRRAGTENVAAIVGFGKAAELALTELTDRHQHMQGLQEYLENRLMTEFPQLRIFGQQAKRIPNTTFFAVPGVDGEALLMMLDQAGFAVSSGSACGTGEVEPSHVLLAMGINEETARAAVRVSTGIDTTRNELDQFVDTLKEKIRLLQSFGAVA